MTKIGALAHTALALALLAGDPLMAQPPAGSEQAQPAKEETQDKNAVGAADSRQSSPAPTPAPAPAPGKTEDSPFDYQSSEKISEDLSVSFPVDI